MVFKQLLQAEAIDVVQIDSCRLAGVSEVISVLLMAAKQVHPFVLSEPLNQFLGSVSLYALTREVSDYVNM
jgi:L-alanine-DL-glutamate epimerase-like enolase superfamily enzyme